MRVQITTGVDHGGGEPSVRLFIDGDMTEMPVGAADKLARGIATASQAARTQQALFDVLTIERGRSKEEALEIIGQVAAREAQATGRLEC